MSFKCPKCGGTNAYAMRDTVAVSAPDCAATIHCPDCNAYSNAPAREPADGGGAAIVRALAGVNPHCAIETIRKLEAQLTAANADAAAMRMTLRTLESQGGPYWQELIKAALSATAGAALLERLDAAELKARKLDDAMTLLADVYRQAGNSAPGERRHALTPNLRDAIRYFLALNNHTPNAESEPKDVK